ncbi:MAG: hypothetical protein ABIR04_06505, partial [Cypionkella sp.]
MSINHLGLCVALALALPTVAVAEKKPLSAIDWLSQSVKTPMPKGSVAPKAPAEPVSAVVKN